jgi:hypothetical protein
MVSNRMNRDEFYAAMAPADEARLRKILWILYWRGDTRLRERVEGELRPPEQPKVKPRTVVPDPDTVLTDVSAFVELARDGAYMYGDRRVHHTERPKWRITFRRLAGEALAALQAGNPRPGAAGCRGDRGSAIAFCWQGLSQCAASCSCRGTPSSVIRGGRSACRSRIAKW